jgi:magnesium transporter
MPELRWRWAYPVLWALMIGIGVGMVVWFKRKRWL